MLGAPSGAHPPVIPSTMGQGTPQQGNNSDDNNDDDQDDEEDNEEEEEA